MGVRLLALVLGLVLAACGGGVTTPTPSPQPLTAAQLKYRVIDELGRPFFCDPDFYPVARADEADLARQRFPELQKDVETFSVIIVRLRLTDLGETVVRLIVAQQNEHCRIMLSALSEGEREAFLGAARKISETIS